MRCYNEGDTIYFENTFADIDTITILDVDSAKGEKCFGFIAPRPIGKSCWVTIKILPFDHWHNITIDGTNGDTVSINHTNLIRLNKDPINNKVYFDFEFKDFYTASEAVLGKLHLDTLIINERRITNYYLIAHGFPDRLKDTTSIETLIWTDKDGLTAYKNKSDVWWSKKKSSR